MFTKPKENRLELLVATLALFAVMLFTQTFDSATEVTDPASEQSESRLAHSYHTIVDAAKRVASLSLRQSVQITQPIVDKQDESSIVSESQGKPIVRKVCLNPMLDLSSRPFHSQSASKKGTGSQSKATVPVPFFDAAARTGRHLKAKWAT